jgi:hypothetical protein
MKARRLLILTAIVSSILGAFAVYLALTVPNDLKADAMLKAARKNVEAGKRDPARDELARIVQQYPRTDAAAAATVALVKLADEERKELKASIAAVKAENGRQAQALADLQQKVATLAAAPPPAPVVIAPAKTAPAKKPAPKRRTTRRPRRRR